MINTEKFEAEFDNLLAQDAEATLQIITGMFVGLTIGYTRQRGFDGDGDITIEGNEKQRAITIHKLEPKKEDK